MMDQTQQSMIFLVIFTIWASAVYIRVFDKTLKRYTALIGVCLILWMIIKIIKKYVPTTLSEYMWYLYYIPLLFIPAFYYNCSDYLKNNSKKKRCIVMCISFVLFLFVITNSYHRFVFSKEDANGNYTHRFIYYLICAWIFILLIMSIINLIKVGMTQRNKSKIIIPFIPIILGLIYTVLYVSGNKLIIKTNMSTIMGTLFCIGMEVLLNLGLIPNNFRYKKIFANSNLPLEIISKDGLKSFCTNHDIAVKNEIKQDIEKNKLKKQYKTENKIQNVKTIYGGYAIEEKDLSKINELKKELQSTNQKLLNQENLLQNQKKMETEIYEMKLNHEITELLDKKINEKRSQISKMLDEMEVPDLEKMYIIKLLISYCKRMSSLIISNYNKEKYNNERIELILNELLSDEKSLNVNGLVQVNNFELSSSETISVYEIVFSVLSGLKDVNFILNIEVNNASIKLKYLFDKNIQGLKQKLEEEKIEKVMQMDEKAYDNETNLELKIVRGES